MANILNNQASFVLPSEQYPSHFYYSWLEHEIPSTGLRDPREGAPGSSQGDAIIISDDDESDYSDLEDDAPDTSFPPPHKLHQPPGTTMSNSG